MTIKIPKWLLLCITSLFLSQGATISDSVFEYAKNLEIFGKLYTELSTNYVDEIEPGKLMKTGIDAMLKSLDPYTVYFSEYQAEEALMDRQGQYGGVGCRTNTRNGYPEIIEIMEGYAFDKAGIKLGDIITHFNNIDLKDKTSDEIMMLMRGAPNTSFQITFKRQGNSMVKQITRMVIKTNSVTFSQLLKNDIAYVKLEEFNQGASAEIEKGLKEMMKKASLRGVILDLRDNGGGLLNEAVQIVGLFVGENKLVVSLNGQNPQGPKQWITPNKAILPNTPLIVLINERSASASEVVSGSLQDLDRAVIMGQNSFGKGLVQNYISLPYRTQMKITTAKYYTPSGRCIQRLNYDEKDATGKATVKSQEQKRVFNTKNGRKVFEAGGIDPDVLTDPFKGSEISKWLDKHLIIFDFANKLYFSSPSDTLNFTITQSQINEFVDFATNKTIQILNEAWSKQMSTDSKIPTIIATLTPFNNPATINKIKTEITSAKPTIEYKLKLEMMQRKLSRQSFISKSLSIDSELDKATNLILNSADYNQILSPSAIKK